MCTRYHSAEQQQQRDMYPWYHDMLVFDIRNVRFVTVEEFLELERVISFFFFLIFVDS